MVPETARDYLRLRRGILDHVLDGDLSWFDASVFIWLALEADPYSGIVRTSAPVLAQQYRLSVHRIRKTLRKLHREIQWIFYEERAGQRGVFPIGIFKYPLPDGAYTIAAEEWSERRSSPSPQPPNENGGDWTKVWIRLAAERRTIARSHGLGNGEPSGEPSVGTQQRDIRGTNPGPAPVPGESLGEGLDQGEDQLSANRPNEEEEEEQEGRRTSPEIPLDDLEERVIREWKSQYCNRYPVPPKMDLDHRRDRVRARSIIDRIRERAEAFGEQYNDEDVINAFGWAAGNAVKTLAKDRCTLAWIESTIDQWIDWDEDAEAAS